jgi:hypothetical protein
VAEHERGLLRGVELCASSERGRVEPEEGLVAGFRF